MNTNKTFTAIDFETATSDRMACQVGLVTVKDGEIVDRIEYLIQPPHNFYHENTIRVHHITPDMTKDAPTFDKVWEKIEPYLVNTTIVAHNADFDQDVLIKNLEYYGIMAMGIQPFVCTCKLYGRASLKTVCTAYGMSMENHHDGLFDAECCAQIYLKYLDGGRPDIYKFTKKSMARSSKLKGEILEKDLTNADPNNPFYDRKVVITGDFSYQRSEMARILKSMGADINTTISKKTNFVLVGEEPGPAKMEKIDKLRHDGFQIVTLEEKDFIAILEGDWERYQTEKDVKKGLSLTYDHFEKHHLSFDGDYNIIASKELYYGESFAGNFDLFNQITGNLGACGDRAIYPETNICVLSDATIEKLKVGETDATITYIQEYYNTNKSITFDFDFLTESDILDYCKRRCEKYNDEVTMELYEKYMESAIANQEKKSKYEFEEGKNYVKVNGKYVFKTADGRTWCPSRQFRG